MHCLSSIKKRLKHPILRNGQDEQFEMRFLIRVRVSLLEGEYQIATLLTRTLYSVGKMVISRRHEWLVPSTFTLPNPVQ